MIIVGREREHAHTHPVFHTALFSLLLSLFFTRVRHPFPLPVPRLLAACRLFWLCDYPFRLCRLSMLDIPPVFRYPYSTLRPVYSKMLKLNVTANHRVSRMFIKIARAYDCAKQSAAKCHMAISILTMPCNFSTCLSLVHLRANKRYSTVSAGESVQAIP